MTRLVHDGHVHGVRSVRKAVQRIGRRTCRKSLRRPAIHANLDMIDPRCGVTCRPRDGRRGAWDDGTTRRADDRNGRGSRVHGHRHGHEDRISGPVEGPQSEGMIAVGDAGERVGCRPGGHGHWGTAVQAHLEMVDARGGVRCRPRQLDGTRSEESTGGGGRQRRDRSRCVDGHRRGHEDRVSGPVEGPQGQCMGAVGEAGERVRRGAAGHVDRRTAVEAHLEMIDARGRV